MAESRATDDDATNALRSEIVSTTVDLLGVAPDDVVLAPPRTVPKTSSGKIRRAASREIYEQGKISARPRALWWELARFRLRGAVPSVRRARRAMGAVAFAAYAWTVYAALALSVIVLLVLLPRGAGRRRRDPDRQVSSGVPNQAYNGLTQLTAYRRSNAGEAKPAADLANSGCEGRHQPGSMCGDKCRA